MVSWVLLAILTTTLFSPFKFKVQDLSKLLIEVFPPACAFTANFSQDFSRSSTEKIELR